MVQKFLGKFIPFLKVFFFPLGVLTTLNYHFIGFLLFSQFWASLLSWIRKYITVCEVMMPFHVILGTTIRSRVVDLKKSTVIRDNTHVPLSV